MKFPEVLAMLLPKWMRRASPEPTLKDLRGQVADAARIVAEHSVVIQRRCAEKRLERTGEVRVETPAAK